MSRKARIRTTSIFFIWILVCTVLLGAVEGAVIKESKNVEVDSYETVIIDCTYTHKYRNRVFHIDNGENEIIATAWGSNDEKTWEVMETTTISPEQSDTLVMGKNHYWYVKLTGKTTGFENSVVDACLYYHEA
jgi:hypothetical protein